MLRQILSGCVGTGCVGLLLFFIETSFEEQRQGFECLFSLRALSMNNEFGIFLGSKHEELEYTVAIHSVAILHYRNLSIELLCALHKHERRPRVQTLRVRDNDLT